VNAALGVMALLLWPLAAESAAVKGVYVGADFYAPGAAAQEAARVSGFTRLFLSFLHVDARGDVFFNRTPVVQDGVYIGDTNWSPSLAALKLGAGGISRIELVLGEPGDDSYANIRQLLGEHDAVRSNRLWRDLVALKSATGAEAIQLNGAVEELNSVIAVGQLAARAGFKVTVSLHSDAELWRGRLRDLGEALDGVYLHCYAEGRGHDVAEWVRALPGIPVYPGLWGNTDTPTSALLKFRRWQQEAGIDGGFLWLNGLLPSDAIKWAGALAHSLDPLARVHLINRNSGKLMALAEGGLTNGTSIIQAGYHGGAAQRWLLVPTESGGHFRLVAWPNGQSASIAFSSSLPGTQLWSWDYHSDPSQQFDLVDAGNGWFKLRNVRSGLVLEIGGASLANNALVQQYADLGTPNQLWRICSCDEELLAGESFDYPAGKLGGQNGGVGWGAAWLDKIGSGAAVNPGSLDAGSNAPAGFQARTVGNSAWLPEANRVGRYLDCSAGGPFGAYGYLDANGRVGADGTTLYLSFLQKPERVRMFYELELNRGLNRVAGIGNDTSSNVVCLRAPGDAFTPIGAGDTNVNLYVMRIDFKEGNDDVRLYRNPVSRDEPAAPTLMLPEVADLSFDRICLAAFANSNAVTHDEIRLARSWRAALGEEHAYAVQSASLARPEDIFRRARFSAQVLYGRRQVYYLRDGDAAIRAQLSQPADFVPGDTLEVTGLVESLGRPVRLIEAVARKVGRKALPEPRRLEEPEARFEAAWVWAEGALVEVKKSGDEACLGLQKGMRMLPVRVRLPDPTAGDWAVGSRLKVSGVLVRSAEPRSDGRHAEVFELLVHSPEEVEVLSRPPWWTLKRLLVIVAALGAGLALAFAWIRSLRRLVELRTTQLERETRKREQMEQQRIIAEERARISRDLHDDLGSKLTKISMLATLRPGPKTTPEMAGERLRLIAEKSRGMVSALDEVVWMMNPKPEALSSFAAYLAAYAGEFLAKTEIVCRVESPESYLDRVITSEARNHLFLAFKEAVNNAVRHGKPTRLRLRFKVSGENFEVRIQDNGCGFDVARASSGNGLANLQERLRKLKGSCRVDSAPGQGTTVSLTLPLAD
jgi:signal transduction histidine kinase